MEKDFGSAYFGYRLPQVKTFLVEPFSAILLMMALLALTHLVFVGILLSWSRRAFCIYIGLWAFAMVVPAVGSKFGFKPPPEPQPNPKQAP